MQWSKLVKDRQRACDGRRERAVVRLEGQSWLSTSRYSSKTAGRRDDIRCEDRVSFLSHMEIAQLGSQQQKTKDRSVSAKAEGDGATSIYIRGW
jgi:hypothetical protein